ncbi:hypothetical protein [Microvirga flavescens]|uniref:hypothetical protein n=1 Tax=Microvirga flavescens TaxID=2249811 RepID=UPI000DD520BD|nr:hypothetical protein [Microvirga flavescens]
MAGTKHDELDALRADLRKAREPKRRRAPAPQAKEPDPVATDTSATAELQKQLKDLEEVLSEYAESAEDIIAKHPLVAVGAAFVLGIAIGRLFGRD